MTFCAHFCSEYQYDIKKTIFEFLMFCMMFGFNALLYTLIFGFIDTLITIIKNVIGGETDLFFKRTFIYLFVVLPYFLDIPIIFTIAFSYGLFMELYLK